MASEMLSTWGPERTGRVSPLDLWLAAGAELAAGTDIVRPSTRWPTSGAWWPGALSRPESKGPSTASTSPRRCACTRWYRRPQPRAGPIGQHRAGQARWPGCLPHRPGLRRHLRTGRPDLLRSPWLAAVWRTTPTSGWRG